MAERNAAAGSPQGADDERNPAAGSPQGADDERTFEELLEELEQVTEVLAAGEVGIEAAADLYERAQRLHTLASQRLASVQERVDRLGRA